MSILILYMGRLSQPLGCQQPPATPPLQLEAISRAHIRTLCDLLTCMLAQRSRNAFRVEFVKADPIDSRAVEVRVSNTRAQPGKTIHLDLRALAYAPMDADLPLDALCLGLYDALIQQLETVVRRTGTKGCVTDYRAFHFAPLEGIPHHITAVCACASARGCVCACASPVPLSLRVRIPFVCVFLPGMVHGAWCMVHGMHLLN